MHAQLAAEEEHRRHDSEGRQDVDRLQRVEVVEPGKHQQFGGAEIERETGRMRIVIGNIEVMQAESEENLVPIPR